MTAYYVRLLDTSVHAESTKGGVSIDGAEFQAILEELCPGEARVTFEGQTKRIFVQPTGSGWRIRIRGRTLHVDVADKRLRELSEIGAPAGGTSSHHELRAPMPGLVVRLPVEVGTVLAPGDPLVVIEAMKMENELQAEGAGVVEWIGVSVTESVNRDQVLMKLGPILE